MEKRKIKNYCFGYDFDSIKDVQDHVIDNYDAGDYNMHVALGDDVMNNLTIFRGEDKQLDSLIDRCDGAGTFEE
jgi:hypothetical protein